MYANFFQHILNPFYEKVIKRTDILKHRRFLEESQWWDREKLSAYQWGEMKKLLHHAYLQVPYWNRLMLEKGLTPTRIKTYKDFCRFPLVTKDDIRMNKQKMTARNFRGRTWTKLTGGSTGVPLELDYNPGSYDWRQAVTKRGYGWAGCEDGIRQAYIWGADIGEVSFLAYWKKLLHQKFYRQWFFNSFEFDDTKMNECLKALNRIQPKVIIGYTNPLYHFAEFVLKRRKRQFQPITVISGAEKLHDFQRKIIEKAFGCPVFNTYGSREFMLMASECPARQGMHINMENVFLEVVKEDGQPAESGETGDIVVTDLHNYGMPFIRYKIGDSGVMADKPCPCGRGSVILQDVIGRSLDMIKTPEGRYVPGEFFSHLMKEFRGVRQFQVVQNVVDELEIKIVKDASLDEGDLQSIKNEIIKVLGEKIRIKYYFIDDIPLTSTGKRRVTVSNLPARKVCRQGLRKKR